MPIIYLSPSTQEYNQYVTGGNEEQVMNRLADAMVPYLRSSGIQYVRNSPGGNVNQSIAESNAGRFDLHLALHSNASPEHIVGQLQGPDVYYNPNNYWSRRFAEILGANLRRIYPYPELVTVLPSSNLAEVRRVNAPSVLLEVAYHDNPEDAAWIQNNLDSIARTIVLALTEYFGIPFVEPQPVMMGRVTTNGTPLLLRSRPNTGAPIIARMPNGAEVTILSRLPNGWFVVSYGGREGYASGNYITPV